ncbi:TIGR00730 family Rossman fold protein [Persicobacter diffluens]|uniref:Cytokinin riboside 5'-monophosphate phosphoribohydrolase n=1 Tax=Persicobacter diffluens TaxID=981 RepID=A0AAN4W431_9BACT|nr:cytokinin riboside 5'-monophosphate phosphoribohydrolase [Persicobacter diffluens]
MDEQRLIAKRVAVFCGSKKGLNERYEQMAFDMGAALAKAGWEVVFGGSSSGLMGAMASGVMHQKGRLLGVYPPFLKERELVHRSLDEIYQVADLAERKKVLSELTIGSICLPGGVGTMDELFEMMTFNSIGQHNARFFALHNVHGYYDHLMRFFDQMADGGFVSDQILGRVVLEEDCQTMVKKIEHLSNLSGDH